MDDHQHVLRGCNLFRDPVRLISVGAVCGVVRAAQAVDALDAEIGLEQIEFQRAADAALVDCLCAVHRGNMVDRNMHRAVIVLPEIAGQQHMFAVMDQGDQCLALGQ